MLWAIAQKDDVEKQYISIGQYIEENNNGNHNHEMELVMKQILGAQIVDGHPCVQYDNIYTDGDPEVDSDSGAIKD